MRLHPPRFCRLGAVVTLVTIALSMPVPGLAPSVAGQPATRPNVADIGTDDMRADDLWAMPHLRALLAEQGTTFANFFVTTPVCCPSRASILRGQYAHNHGALGDAGPNGGFQAFHRLGDEGSTLATWIHDAGYRTALIGKYLNGYPRGASPTYVPPGWDEWDGALSEGKYFRFDLNENGRVVSYAGRTSSSEQRRTSADARSPDVYSTDVFTGKATTFIKHATAEQQPFFLYLATDAPHGPAKPAPRDEEAFADARAPRASSFNEADVSDKPAWVRALPSLDADQTAQIDAAYRNRLRSLLAVDDLVNDLIATQQATGTLDETYVVFTSDNGYLLGEHRIGSAKRAAYEESIRVPLLVRGPGVPAGAVVDQLALNIDLAPTVAAWAGAISPDFVDGRSLAPLLSGNQPPIDWRRAFLVEHPSGMNDQSEEDDSAVGIPSSRALRTPQVLYVENAGGERKVYDLRADPFELDNLAATAEPFLLAELSARLSELSTCTALACRAAEDAPLPSLTITATRRPGPASTPTAAAIPSTVPTLSAEAQAGQAGRNERPGKHERRTARRAQP